MVNHSDQTILGNANYVRDEDEDEEEGKYYKVCVCGSIHSVFFNIILQLINSS